MCQKPSYEELEQKVLELERAEYECKRGKEACGGNERHLSQIVHGMAIPVFVMDKEHCITHWNKACERLTGISAGDMIGTQDAWRAFYPKKRSLLADLVVDGAPEDSVAEYYGGKYSKSELVEGGYDVQDFFPRLGEGGKWLFLVVLH